MFNNRAYDLKFLKRSLLWIAVFIVAMKATGGNVSVVFPIIAFSALSSGNMVRLFFLFMLMICGQVGNTYFFPKTYIYAMSVRVTLGLLALVLSSRLAGGRHSHFITPFLGMLPYLLWECVSSIQGFAPIISYLKLVLFTVIYFGYYAIANAVLSNVRTDSRKIRSVVLAFACLYVLGSVLLIPFPGIGLMTMTDWGGEGRIIYMESLFKGMAMHAQSLGPLVAVFSVLIFGDFIFAVRKMDKLYIAILLACPILVWKTSSRTALGTYLMGMMMVASFLMRARNVGVRWKEKIMSCIWLVVIVVSVSVFAVPRAREGVFRFALKMRDSQEKIMASDVSFEKVTSSRLGLIDESMNNFRKKPVLGNGFQVSSELAGEHKRGLLSYFSAPIEKGVWYAAVLEEGGVIGFVIFVIFLATAFFSLVRYHAYITASCFFTLLMSNFGEFTFFSMSYTGGLIWALVFAAVILDSQRVAQARQMARLAAPWPPGEKR